MKKNGLLLGAEVVVKVPFKGTVDQITGTITAVDNDSITVTEKVEEGKEARVFTLPKKSVEALAFVKNPNVPDAEVEDGALFVNGTEIRTGFEVLEVIATLANRVYITVKVEDTDRVDVYSYNVAKDEFYKVTSKALALNLDELTEIGSSVLIPFLNKREEVEDVKKEDGTVEKVPYEVLEDTGYLMISTKSSFANIVSAPLSTSEILEARTAGDDAVIFAVTSDLTTEITEDYDDCDDEYDDDDYDDDDYDEDYSCERAVGSSSGRIKKLEEGKIVVRIFKAVGRHLSMLANVLMPGEFVSALTAGKTTVIKTSKEIDIMAAGRSYRITDKAAIRDLDGFTYVVKDEVKNGVTKLWFADANANLKVYSVTPSDDARGPIIAVD